MTATVNSASKAESNIPIKDGTMTHDRPSEEHPDEHPFALLPRPYGQLRSLPTRYRWEVTRRHPIYLSFWTSVAKFYENAPLTQPGEAELRQAAVVLLGSIGVSGPPTDPSIEFDDIPGSGTAESLLAGSVHPVTNRGLVGLLIGALPKETLTQLGCLLLNRFAPGGNEDDQKGEALLQLTLRTDPGLDGYVDEPILSVSPSASQRVIERDLEIAMSQWRETQETLCQRERIDQYPGYLEVWDLREGWRNGSYDNSRELTLREVAQQLQLPLSTVNNRYRRAFELITGHRYTPAIWLRVFAIVKLLENVVEVIGNVARHRPHRTGGPRHIPDSAISTPDREGTYVESNALAPASGRMQDLLIDLQEFISQGLTNTEILDRFQIGPEHEPAIETLRQRLGENPTFDD
ncbi:hypothetical protein SH661x_002894 [Planctomicrobium sp. SH661]|uniref:hypothetical protein n=1 Tax=Planctomicrobium sp. SH661 TaxID=3448124 RepID=UPI003F5B6F0A